jgi:hypothetical protein
MYYVDCAASLSEAEEVELADDEDAAADETLGFFGSGGS